MIAMRIPLTVILVSFTALTVTACSQTADPPGPAAAAIPAQTHAASAVVIAGSAAPDPLEQPARQSQTGIASWYGEPFHGRLTASGEVFDMEALTAAHPDLPLRSLARVTRLDNGASVVVRINDRGPFVHGRIVDLSRAAARRLGLLEDGVAEVRVEAFGPADPRDRAAVSGFVPRQAVSGTRETGNR